MVYDQNYHNCFTLVFCATNNFFFFDTFYQKYMNMKQDGVLRKIWWKRHKTEHINLEGGMGGKYCHTKA
jgi:hypothetical protein